MGNGEWGLGPWELGIGPWELGIVSFSLFPHPSSLILHPSSRCFFQESSHSERLMGEYVKINHIKMYLEAVGVLLFCKLRWGVWK